MKTSWFLPALFLLSALIIGCSPVAWAPRETPQVSSIGAGERLTLELRDGSAISGVVASVGDLSDATYDRYYAARSTGGILPAIGDRVAYTTALDEKKVWTGTLVGFDESRLLVLLPGESAPERVYFSSVAGITSPGGHTIHRMELRGMYLNGQIPLKSSVTLRVAGTEREVPLNEIARIGLAPTFARGAAITWLTPSQVTWLRG